MCFYPWLNVLQITPKYAPEITCFYTRMQLQQSTNQTRFIKFQHKNDSREDLDKETINIYILSNLELVVPLALSFWCL